MPTSLVHDVLGWQSIATENRIDELVFQIYGLTETVIRTPYVGNNFDHSIALGRYQLLEVFFTGSYHC